jgi:hypothetical protein
MIAGQLDGAKDVSAPLIVFGGVGAWGDHGDGTVDDWAASSEENEHAHGPQAWAEKRRQLRRLVQPTLQ